MVIGRFHWAWVSTGRDTDVNVVSQTCCRWLSPAPSSNFIVEKYDKNICVLLVNSFSAWSSGDFFQVNISSCGLHAVKGKCITVLFWR